MNINGAIGEHGYFRSISARKEQSSRDALHGALNEFATQQTESEQIRHVLKSKVPRPSREAESRDSVSYWPEGRTQLSPTTGG